MHDVTHPRLPGPPRATGIPDMVLLLLVVGCLGGCTGSGFTSSRPADASDADLRRQLVEWKQRAVMGEVEVERLRAKVERLERELADARSAPRSNAPSPGRAHGAQGGRRAVESPGLDDEVGGRGPLATVEEIELEEPPGADSSVVPGSSQSQRPGRAPNATVEPATVEPPVERPGAAGQPAVEPAAAGGEGETAQSLYDRGYALFHKKRYAEAEAAFRRVLEAHPTSPLADNAQFWIGECRFARGDFSSALSAYSATIERFPSGNKVPEAMLKAGRCLEALGQNQEAAEIYREIVKRFEGTVVADQASDRLARLGR
ncbi:MAG: tol-pal system protein YbgF [Holophagales bacterium]|nr:tol-pal system protein YbgF [Holophagales bacterium]